MTIKDHNRTARVKARSMRQAARWLRKHGDRLACFHMHGGRPLQKLVRSTLENLP